MGSLDQAKAEAQVPSTPEAPKPGPFSAGEVFPTVLMFVVAAAGGLVAFYRKWKAGKVRAFNLVELVGELVVSGVCGIVGYWLMKGFSVNEYLMAGAVGVIGHMGSRFLFMVEEVAEQWLRHKLGAAVDRSGDVMQRKGE